MTLGLVIKRSELLAEAERCCQEMASHIAVEKHDCHNWSSFLAWLQQIQPQIILIDVEHFQNILDERVREVKAASPHSMIIALHDTADAQMILAGMRAGIEEYFYPPLEKSLRSLLERKIDEHTRNQFVTNADRRTIAFLSAKGGCGGTTVSCHVALELGKRMHQAGTYHVLLADLDVTGGNIRFLMRADTPYSIVDAMGSNHGLDVVSWSSMVSNGYPGLEVLAAPENLRVQHMPEQRDIERVLSFARSRYQWTILDLGCSLTPAIVSILENIHELYLVASPDVLAIYQVRQILNALNENKYPAERIRLVLNQSAEFADPVVAEDAARMLKIATFFWLPNDHAGLTEAYASGNFLTDHSPLARQISQLATKICGIDDRDKAASRREPWYRKFRASRGLVAQQSST